MLKSITVTMISVLTLTWLAACSSPAIQTVEVTRLGPQTVVVTQVHTQVVTQLASVIVTATQAANETPKAFYATPSMTPTTDVSGGEIAIIQYYTYLGLHLYHQAYELYGSKLQSTATESEYITKYFSKLKVVKILNIWRYDTIPNAAGGYLPPGYFLVELYLEGELYQNIPVKNNISYFVQAAMEEGIWKIIKITTGP
jgi:hypothetical protein